MFVLIGLVCFVWFNLLFVHLFAACFGCLVCCFVLTDCFWALFYYFVVSCFVCDCSFVACFSLVFFACWFG